MYVCVCNAVTDREVRGAVELGARCLADLQSQLGVATCCRRCADCAEAILNTTLSAQATASAGCD